MKDMKNGGKRRHHGFDGHEFHAHAPGHGPDAFGPGGPGGPRRGGRGGRPRGDVRAAVLVLLSEQPRHGYDLMRAIEERSGGGWAPSPGSIYPTLQALEDEGLVTFETVDGRKTASLTEAGKTWVDEHSDHVEAVFMHAGRAVEMLALRSEVHGIHEAAMLIARRHNTALAESAAAIVAGARKDLYRLLAEEG